MRIRMHGAAAAAVLLAAAVCQGALAAGRPLALTPIRERFEAPGVSPERWQLSLTGGGTAQFEPAPVGRALHLYAPKDCAAVLLTRQAVPNVDYTLEYSFRQPAGEAHGYQAVVSHPRPGGNAYWWLEYGPDRFFLYTLAGGVWFNRWSAGGLPPDTWYRIRIRNTPDNVRVSVSSADGRLLAESPAIPHDTGDPAPLSFSASSDSRGDWGMQVADIGLAVTPVREREGTARRTAEVAAARAALGSQETLRLWPDAPGVLAPAEAALAAVTSAADDDRESYDRACARCDEAMADLGRRYRQQVLKRLPPATEGWTTPDIAGSFDASGADLALALPGAGPLVRVRGVPFALLGFGRNCLLQDVPTRAQRAIRLDTAASRAGLLLAPLYDHDLYDHDDSLVDVLQVEVRYADGFRERIVPTLAGWSPASASGVGQPPMENRKLDAYVLTPGHRAPVAEIVLCDAAAQAGWALFALSYQPGLPAPVTNGAQRAARLPSPTAPDPGWGVVRSRDLTLYLDARRGLIRSASGPSVGAVVRPEAPSPFFAVQMGGQTYYSDAFRVVSARTRAGGGLVTTLRGPGAEGTLEVGVALEPLAAGGIRWRASLTNMATAPVAPRLVFPLLDGLDLGPRPSWYFPQRGGAASDVPFEGLSSYGGMAWLQLLQASRAHGGGIALRSDDSTGVYKVFGLRSAGPGDAPRRWAEIPPQAHVVDPWRAKTGVHLSIQYLPPTLRPGASWQAPAAVLSAHPGNWRQALVEYRGWLKTWWRAARPCPDRYRYGFYALVGGVPTDAQRGDEFGSYDWWHLSHIWGIDYPSELRQPLEDLKQNAARAARWGQAAGLYIEGMCVEKSHRVASEHGAQWAMKDDTGRYYDYYSTASVPVWNMCPAVAAWRVFDASAYAQIAAQTPLAALYVDSLGSRWSEVCYNLEHRHATPGIWPQGAGALFETIRQAVRNVSPGTAIHSEEPGCDYMALHEDGSWSHSLWTSVSGDPDTNPAGLNYFRFVLPEFKMYEIPSYRHALWRCKLAFFNGEGLWTAIPDAARRDLFIPWMPTLREHADTFQSTDVTPALPVAAPPVYVNRFRAGQCAVYTVYNAGLRTERRRLTLDVPAGAHVVDLLRLAEVPCAVQDGRAGVDVAPDPHQVLCLLVAPRTIRAARNGDRLTIGLLRPAPAGARLSVTAIDAQGVRRRTVPVPVAAKQRQASIDTAALLEAGATRLLVRLATAHDTTDEICLECEARH